MVEMEPRGQVGRREMKGREEGLERKERLVLVELQESGETKETLVVLATLEPLVIVGKVVCEGPLEPLVGLDKMVVKVLQDQQEMLVVPDSLVPLVQLASQAAMEMMETKANRVAVALQAPLDLLGIVKVAQCKVEGNTLEKYSTRAPNMEASRGQLNLAGTWLWTITKSAKTRSTTLILMVVSVLMPLLSTACQSQMKTDTRNSTPVFSLPTIRIQWTSSATVGNC